MHRVVKPGQEALATEGDKQRSLIVSGCDAGAWKRVSTLVSEQRMLYPGPNWAICPTHDGLRAVRTR